MSWKSLYKRAQIENKELDIYWDELINRGIATEEELRLVTNINGYNERSLDAVLYAKTGYRSLEQIDEEY